MGGAAGRDGCVFRQGTRPSRQRRNGIKSKKVRSSGGYIDVSTPRDRNGEFEPMLVKNRECELHTGMDEIIISLYAGGNSIDDIHYPLRITHYTLHITHYTLRISHSALNSSQLRTQGSQPQTFLSPLSLFFPIFAPRKKSNNKKRYEVPLRT